jgi:undecaprenyl-diphosphatase
MTNNALIAALLGIVQGITEYLPISSSAHLAIVPYFLGIEDPGLAFDVALHTGTLLATFLFFWKSWLEILKHPFSKQQISVIHLTVATLPAVIIGLMFHHQIDHYMRGWIVMGFALIVGGILLAVTDRFKSSKNLTQMSIRDAFLVGVLQCLSLIPGISRSGSTMIGGRILGYDRVSSAQFSFLISLPITLGAILFEFKDLLKLEAAGKISITSLTIGLIFTWITGMLTIRFLLNILKKISFDVFALYRVVLGVILIAFAIKSL